jgi:thiol-disulfide isomerase/thioredoxin
MSYLYERDALNGKQGKAFLTLNGEINELFSIKKLQTDVEYQKADFKVVGTTTVQQKTTGAKKTGSMTIYFGTPLFIQMAQEYERNGKVIYFDIQVENDDPATSVGKQTVVYYGCSLDKIPLSMLDSDSDFLEEEVGFSFTSFEVLDNFNNPTNLG